MVFLCLYHGQKSRPDKEALEARTNPLRFIAKDIAKVSHHAGVEAAKYGALVGGSVSHRTWAGRIAPRL